MIIMRGDRRKFGRNVRKLDNKEIREVVIPWMERIGVPIRRTRTTT